MNLVVPPSPAPGAADPALQALAAVAARPFEQAVALPPAIYTSETVLRREEERIFCRAWICAGRASSLAEPGDYVAFDILDQPVFLIRGRDGTLRAFANVCRHRMSRLLEGCGRAQGIVCPYHAWSYGLDGRLLAAPLMDGRAGFDKAAHGLKPLACEVWRGWAYVTLDPDPSPVADQLRQLDELVVGRYRMEDYVEVFREEHVWNTNWKVLAENFMESYHLPKLHAATVGGHSKIEEMDCPPGGPAFNYHWITKEASLPIGNAHPDNRHLEGHWRNTTAIIAIYPNHLVTLTPGYFWYLVLQPDGVGRVRILYGGGLSPEFVADPDGPRMIAELKILLDRVNEEDRTGVEAVFRGMKSAKAQGGRLSHLERPNYEFGQYLARALGVPAG